MSLSSPAKLLRNARARAGLSCRALAERAGVSASTITRIESGEMDPTFTTLQRVVAAAGQQLDADIEEISDQPSIARLARTAGGGPRFRWNELRGFLDWERQHPEAIEAGIATPPSRTDPAIDALFAGIAEKLADDSGFSRPRWCDSVPPLESPWEPPGTPRMIARARAKAPEQLRNRNIFIAEEDLWRQRA